MKPTQEGPIVFFDGVCNLCNSFVNLLMSIDKNSQFRIASLQGDTAKRLIKEDKTVLPDSVILLKEGKLFVESDAVLEIVKTLGGLWKILLIFKIIPRGIRDSVYRAIAARRYKFFGKKDTCRLPTQEEKDRFLD